MIFKKILIGIDDSKFAEHAAKYGFGLAHTFHAEIGLIHIIEPVTNTSPQLADPSMISSLMPTAGVDDLDVLKTQEEYSKTLLKTAAEKFGADLVVTPFSEVGSTAQRILEVSVEFKADLIVVGTHNRSGLERLFLGSIAEHIVRHSHIPVLVVPMPEEK